MSLLKSGFWKRDPLTDSIHVKDGLYTAAELRKLLAELEAFSNKGTR